MISPLEFVSWIEVQGKTQNKHLHLKLCALLENKQLTEAFIFSGMAKAICCELIYFITGSYISFSMIFWEYLGKRQEATHNNSTDRSFLHRKKHYHLLLH